MLFLCYIFLQGFIERYLGRLSNHHVFNPVIYNSSINYSLSLQKKITPHIYLKQVFLFVLPSGKKKTGLCYHFNHQ